MFDISANIEADFVFQFFHNLCLAINRNDISVLEICNFSVIYNSYLLPNDVMNDEHFLRCLATACHLDPPHCNIPPRLSYPS